MNIAATGPHEAQCATCGGVLVPAGDDWQHLTDTGCTLYGEPILCGRDPGCALPAVVGGTACHDHFGFSMPKINTATVLDRDPLE
ncbi:hypothetical protein [Couchioplanes caeruleus]|uniref:Uncharacterized protein n=1 Tax=Couchioplanes caeruleus subsp. caeruleus TaxID=56427 RepID=A0A1K0FRC1_9ACTN|nr:hypothetical protein [Couchioplanes caeruleus]OJF15381.1 hypothetical protein BG844_04580 [Couchioplanes caeruleus subsp. caeruleus]